MTEATQKRDCMFQFATPQKVIINTGLITLAEAEQLWMDNKDNFIDLHSRGHDPEMVIWLNCKDDESYGEKKWHVDFESIVENGAIYNKELQGV